MHPLTGLITLLTVLLLMVLMALVGRARGRHGVKAPATREAIGGTVAGPPASGNAQYARLWQCGQGFCDGP